MAVNNRGCLRLARLICCYVLLPAVLCGGIGYCVDELWIAREIAEARSVAERGDQYWPVEMRRLISRAEAWELNRPALAKRLAADTNGSLSAEGLLMLLRHPSGHDREVFQRHLADQRVNHLLYTNSDLAKICIKVLALRQVTHPTQKDREFVEYWTSRNP